MKVHVSDSELSLTYYNVGMLLGGAVFALIGFVLLAASGFTLELPGVMGVIFILIGLATILFWQRVQVSANKAGATVVLEAKGIIRKNKREFAFADVAAVRYVRFRSVNVNTTSRGRRSTSTSTHEEMQLILQTGEEVLVMNTRRVGGLLSMIGKSRVLKACEQLAEFMGVPLQNQSEGLVGANMFQRNQAFASAPAQQSTQPVIQQNPKN